jgi:hypothetical protein
MVVDSEIQAVDVLRAGGILNPRRLLPLVKDTIARFQLDLSGLTVLTEAASGPYVVTPVMAILAGAQRVIAVTADSRYASAGSVVEQTRMLERLAGCEGQIEIHSGRMLDVFAEADVVTNLGFVRPIDAAAVARMKPTAVVSLMCEAWEYRREDLDLDACRRHGIAVLATNEDHPKVDVFAYSGPLCLKMLLAAQIEVHQSRVVVISDDKFGRVIAQYLRRAGATVTLLPTLRGLPRQELACTDALVVADYCREAIIVGEKGQRTVEEVVQANPGLTVIQFAGKVAAQSLQENGLVVYPSGDLPSHRMGMTLASLGPRPVIALHGAGLKVGEVLAQARRQHDVESAQSIAVANSLGQRISQY